MTAGRHEQTSVVDEASVGGRRARASWRRERAGAGRRAWSVGRASAGEPARPSGRGVCRRERTQVVFATMEGMATIGIISDTHGRLDHRAYAALADVDHIIHAGDIGDPAILRELETLAPVTAVLGNNDFPEYGDSVGRFARPVLEDVRFLVAHYPRDVRVTAAGSAALAPGDPLPDICVHGHTHVPKLEWGSDVRPATLLICPGSAFRPRGGFPRSIAKVSVEGGRILSAHVESLEGESLFTWPRHP